MKKRGNREKKLIKVKRIIKGNSFLIFVRYIILLLVIFSLPIIYLIFTPLTIYFSSLLLEIFFRQVLVHESTIIINSNIFVQIIPACVAGSAYLLLLIINLLVPMDLKKRIYSIFFSCLFLLVFNVLRIFLLIILYNKNPALFYLTHKSLWYFLSTIFVIGIWFLVVKIFRIIEIPFYTDMKYLIKIIKKKK